MIIDARYKHRSVPNMSHGRQIIVGPDGKQVAGEFQMSEVTVECYRLENPYRLGYEAAMKKIKGKRK